MARYWAFYNVLRRAIALWFVSLGSVAVVATVVWVIWPQIYTAEPTTIWGKLATIVAFSLAIVWGIVWMRMPTYRPDMGDTLWIMNASSWAEQRARRQDRSWWTGNPREAAQSAKRFGSDPTAV
jgi:hypothetical protein